MASLRIAGGQLNLTVGDIDGNVQRILGAMAWASEEEADVLLLPELAITGYPPEDLVMRDDFVDDNLAGLATLAASSGETTVVVGFVDRVSELPAIFEDAVVRNVANAAAVLRGGEVVGVYHKQLLPNYGVFDEARHFVPGSNADRLFSVAGHEVGVSICEDIWVPDGPPASQARSGAVVLLNINGSPYHVGKGAERHELLRHQAETLRRPVAYVNLVGGQDELVFDGQSMVIAADGTLVHRSPQFEEDRFIVDLALDGPTASGAISPDLDDDAEVYEALVTGLGDYVRKNGFTDVVIGLSGGIDSALTAAIAVDALGPDHVLGVSMPSPYNSPASLDDAEELAGNLGCGFRVIPIDRTLEVMREALAEPLAAPGGPLAKENLQARIRGSMLMAISNAEGPMVIATGNKSEMAVGYATLYGDMVGGFAVLKDVFKTRVYELARWRNRDGVVIPKAILTKPPSAELRPDQTDEETLGPYEQLDAILRPHIEEDWSREQLVAAGHDEDAVERVIGLVRRSEYKRRQAPPGVKITKKSFGRDRRLPITNPR